MIKEIRLFGRVFYVPGWLNFIILFMAYCMLAIGYLYFIRFINGLLEPFFAENSRDVIDLILGFCGCYLAKWRFYDGGYHFA